MDTQRPWHQLFGLSLVDLLHDQPMTVELEKDLSLKQQLLDVVILRTGSEPLTLQLPDGFENLAAHNLISFKSYQEALDLWAIKELTGHYVNYRKQVSPTMRDLLPETDFRLYAVTVRFPQGLSRQHDLLPVQQAVYELRPFGDSLRIIVVNELPLEEHNAMFHLFSPNLDLLDYGSSHFRQRSKETSTLLARLVNQYRQENIIMPEVLEKFAREYNAEILQKMPAEERLKGMSPEERLKGMPTEERLKGLPAEERLKGLPAEERLKGLPAEERLKGLPAEERLKGLPAEERLKGLPAEERLKGLSAEERLTGLPSEERIKALSPEDWKLIEQLLKEKAPPFDQR